MSRIRFAFRCQLFHQKMTTRLTSQIIKHCLLIIVSTLLLTSCDSGKKIVDLRLKYMPANRVPGRIVDEQAQEQVAEAATAIGRSLQELSAVQMTVHPPKRLQKPFDPHVAGMDKMASINWTGPVEPVLKKIAQASGYQLRVLGRRPAIPALISLDIKNKAIADILRNITYQVVMKADIAVYPKSRTIELRYHGN